MDVHQLELFLAVMESSSMTRAAEHATAVIKRMSQIQQEFANDLSKDTRPFHFATGVTTLIYQLGGPLRQLRKQFPNTEIRVTVGVTEDIVAGLLDRRFDLGLISLPVAEEKLKIMPLFEEELLLLRPSTTKVRGGHVGSIQPADLAGVPFLLYPMRSNIRLVIDQFFRELDLVPNVVMEAEDTEAIKRLCESCCGYSTLPEHAVRGTCFFHTLRVKGHRLTRSLALAMAQADYPRKLTESIASFLQGTLKQK